jgi:serine protease Do
MRQRYVFFLTIALALPCPALAQSNAGEFLRSNPAFMQTFREVVQPGSRSTVRVQCDGKDTCLGTVVAADGWILTKAHDLTGKIVCKLGDGRDFEARIIGVHEAHDLALLRIGGLNLRPIEFATSKDAKPGGWVASVGTGADPAAIGVVSVATRKVNEAYLGVQVEAAPQGLLVTGVMPKSAALKAGVRAKDVLLRVNQHKIADADQMQQILADHKPGDTITLTIRRDDKEQELKLTLQSREQAGDFRSEFQNRLGSDLSKRRSGYSVILQHDSVLKPSDCGGALVDLKGRVIGINISRAGRVETWALPAEVVQPLIAELKSGKLAPKEKKAP